MSDSGLRLTRAVAAEIKRMRTERGWSLEDLADEADLHRTSLGLIERGRRGMSIDVATRLAEALGTPLSDVIAVAEQRLAGE